jgi:uncharacterized membrane protein YfcA
MNVEKTIYESKPIVMIAVGVLALVQLDPQADVFKISGFLLLVTALWILFARMKHRLRKKSEKESNPS